MERLIGIPILTAAHGLREASIHDGGRSRCCSSEVGQKSLDRRRRNEGARTLWKSGHGESYTVFEN